MTPPPDPADADLAALVRQRDRPRYFASLFAPAAIRADLLALYAFAAEIGRIPDLVSEPQIGEIRLQWWLDAVADEEGAGAAANPTLQALGLARSRHKLPVAALRSFIEASRADLYSDPPPRLADLEGRLGETESALFQLAALIAGAAGPESADASGHAGLAYGIARRLAAFAAERARGRTILPLDLLAMEGLAAEDVFAGENGPALAPAFTALAKLAHHHFRNARDHVACLPGPLRIVFLPLAIVPLQLDRIERLGPALVDAPVELSDLAMLSRICWSRWRCL